MAAVRSVQRLLKLGGLIAGVYRLMAAGSVGDEGVRPQCDHRVFCGAPHCGDSLTRCQGLKPLFPEHRRLPLRIDEAILAVPKPVAAFSTSVAAGTDCNSSTTGLGLAARLVFSRTIICSVVDPPAQSIVLPGLECIALQTGDTGVQEESAAAVEQMRSGATALGQ